MKRFFLTLFVLVTVSFSISGKGKSAVVAVVVDPVTYAAIPSDVDAFVASMEQVGKRGLCVVDRWNHPDSIRAELRLLYEKEGLEGAVLVGNIPIPMIRDAHHLTTAFKMNPISRGKNRVFPPTACMTTSTCASII